jgi:hypothetical protein
VTTIARRPAGLIAGRVVGGVAMSWLVGGILLLLAVPAIARLVTCTSDTRPCTSWAFTAVPWWWGGLWSLSLVIGVLVCWPPTRWWTPQDASGRPKLPGVFSTPEWLRLHAVVAAALNAGMLVAEGTPTTGDRVGYAASALLALVTVMLATVCIRVTVDRIPPALHRGIAQGYDAIWLLPAERSLRAAHGGPPAPAPPTPAQRARRAEVWTRSVLVWLTWLYATLCALPVVIATLVLLVARPESEPGPFVLLLLLVWVPWALTLALAITFAAGIRYPLGLRGGRLRGWMLGLVVAFAASTAWYLFVGSPFFGGFRWGLDALLVVQAILAVAIIVRMLIRPDGSRS